jgi:pilus assembly protein CpaB
MKQRFALVLIFALVVSGAASVVLYRLIATQIAANKEAAQAKVLVAARTLPAGELIKEGDVKLADWTGTPPPGSATKAEDLIGRGVIETIYEGEVVLDARVAPRGGGAGLAATIPAGMRAVAVRVNDVVAVSGYATPGSHVDILIAGSPPNGSSAGTVTKTLLQNIEVLSAGQNTQRDAEGKPIIVPVVNLLVTPEQAEILSLASNDARIQLVLRNPMDKEEVKTTGTALAYLFSGGTPPPPASAGGPARVAAPRRAAPPPPPPPAPKVEPPKPPPPPITVEVFHGSRKTEAKFANEENQEAKQ